MNDMFAPPLSRVLRPPGSRLKRYAIAVALVGAATLFRAAIEPLVGTTVPFGLFVPTVIVAAWLGGAEGGLLATALAALAGKFLFIEPRYHATFTTRDIAIVLLAGAVGSGLVLLVSVWRRTQLRLLDLHDEMAGILRQLPAGVVVADRSGRVVFVNTELERLLGGPLRLGMFADFRRQYTPLHADGTAIALSESPLLRAANGEEVPEEEATIVRSDGERRIVRVRGTPVRRHDGTVAGGAVTVVDVTELRETARVARERAEELGQADARLREQARELERVNRLKDEFLATLSHELRTPLTAIVGWAAMLLRGGLSPDVVHRAHETIARNADSQRALIEDVLDVSRIVTGNLRLEKGPADVEGPLRAAVEAVKPQAEEAGVTITTALTDTSTAVWGDSVRLQQVFVNLMSNAIKFSGRGGRIWVSLRRVGAKVEVQVRDNGIGISAEHLPHIFERFRQADSSTTRRHNGLGLGLAIVRHITGLHDGTVKADSPGEGQGATFTVCLPYHPLEEGAPTATSPPRPGVFAGPAAPPSPGSTPTLRGRRVLVVDDEADTRQLVASVLTASGAEVISAASAREALEQLQAGVPDAMLVDISMPEMDGYEFVRAIRNSRSGAEHVPAIAFTAHAREEDRRLALTSGFRMHVAKPVEPTALVRALATVLER